MSYEYEDQAQAMLVSFVDFKRVKTGRCHWVRSLQKPPGPGFSARITLHCFLSHLIPPPHFLTSSTSFFFFFNYLLAMPCDLQDLNSLTRAWKCLVLTTELPEHFLLLFITLSILKILFDLKTNHPKLAISRLFDQWNKSSVPSLNYHLHLDFLPCCCLVTNSCLTLCDPMNYSTAGFPVLHYLLEFAQTHVHWVNDAV